MRMKKLLTFLTLLTLFFGVSWAANTTVTFTFSSLYTSNTVLDETIIDGTDVSLVFNKREGGTTATQYYTNGEAVRWYGGGTLTVSSTTKTITRIEIVYTKHDNSVSASVETYSDITSSGTGTWSGSASSVKFTQSGTSGHARITTVRVTYNDGGTNVETVATPTFSLAAGTYYEAQSVTLSCTTPGSTIYYTTDGNDPTTSSSVYSSAIPVSSTTTIKAIAVKDGMNNSQVASATYTINAPLTSLADVNGLDDNDVFTYGAQTVVLAAYGRDLHIVMPDNTAGALIYADYNNNWSSDYTFGKVINSGWGGTKTTYSTKPEVKNPTNFSLLGTTAEVTPIEITSSNLTSENFGRYAVLKGVNVAADGTIAGINSYNQFHISFEGEAGVYDVYGVIGWHNGNGQFLPIKYEPANVPVYYLVGTFNNWNQSAEYIFTKSGDSYVLNGVDLPDNAEFQINKVVNGVTTWIGGYADGEVYGIHGGHHENIGLGGSKNFKIEAGAITNFSFTMNNDNPDKLTVNRDAQFFVKGDFNGWNREAMTATATGWTIEHVISSANQFGFVDEWGYWYGGRDWWINEEHLDTELEIKPDGNFYMNIDGTDDYTLTVNSAKTTLTVSKIVVVVGGDYELVTDASTLSAGDRVIITNSKTAGTANAMGADRGNNRGAAEITITSDIKITPGSDVQILSLEGDASCWYFNAGDNAYLRADGGSKNNYLKTGVMHDNAKASITSGDNDIAEIVFQITGNRKYLRYNGSNNPPIFSCYESGKQSPVYLFKKMGSEERATPPVITPASQNVKGGLLEGVMITAAEGATIHYTLDGSEPTVDSPVFDGQAFNVTGTGGERKMVRAIAVEADKAPSYPASVTYTFQAPATPTISPDAGTYDEAVTVTITSNDGGIIYYLVDPEEAPTNATGVITAGQVYTEGETTITLSENGTHKVYAAVDLNGITSWAQVTYTIILSTPTPATLAELCATGVTTDGENWYVISDMLKAVYADDVRGLLWCKDLGNQSIDATSIHDGDQIDFLYNDTQAQNKRDWDQSNWIVLEFTTPDQGNNIGLMLTNAQDKLIKPGTIKGKLINNVNYTLKMDLDMIETLTPADEGYSEEPYEENVYCPSNFLPENLNIWGSIENGDGAYTGQNPQNFFFMNPKVQEVCYITYAEWNQEKNCFTVPTGSGFKGAFQVGWAYKTSQQVPTLHDGKVYNFHAVVQRTDKEHYGPNNPISAKDELPYSEYITVLPVDLTGDDNIITAINTVEAGKGEVKSVKYVNVAGVVSDAPFQGVNIVVTEYTDGSRTTSKMLRK